MRSKYSILLGGLIALSLSSMSWSQEALTPEQKAKVEAKLATLKALGSDPTIVAEVKAYNENPPAQAKEMTQEKWKELTVISPEVKAFATNTLGKYLKTKKDNVIAEMFVSGANGNKVAFLSKPSNWCHKGKAKHDDPMQGKTWIGPVELDASTGLQQVQVAFPVLDGNKPIGSIVVGLSVAALE